MIENMKVRRFKEEDAQEVRNLIVRNFLEVNSKDYGISAMAVSYTHLTLPTICSV